MILLIVIHLKFAIGMRLLGLLTLAYSDGSKFRKKYKGLIGISLEFENSNPNKTCHTEGIVEFLHHNILYYANLIGSFLALK